MEESFSITQLLIGYYGISNAALSALIMYDLFHRHDLPALRGTVYSLTAWLVPGVSWILFIMHRNWPRPVSAAQMN